MDGVQAPELMVVIVVIVVAGVALLHAIATGWGLFTLRDLKKQMKAAQQKLLDIEHQIRQK